MILHDILAEVQPFGARLIAVSKTHPPDKILALYQQGQRDFGENRVQEMMEKQPLLPADIRWHLIGRLQSNKVKYIAPFVHLIHSVDSLKLLQEIDKQAAKNNRIIPCLLEFRIASEESKSGLYLDDAISILASEAFRAMKHVKIHGVMGITTLTDDQTQIRAEFRHLRQIFDHLKNQFFPEDPDFRELSMGMSGDYILALEEGSTLVRVGTLLFGPREYF